MQIIAKRSYHFRDVSYEEETLESGKKQLKEILKREFKCQASSNPQHVPDWVKKTDLYKIASKDKDKGNNRLLMEVVTDESEDKPEPEAPKMGWGAKPETGLTV